MALILLTVVYHQPVGGGVALLYASRELDKLPTANFDQRIGVQIVQNALKVLNSLYHFFNLCISFPIAHLKVDPFLLLFSIE